MDQALIKMEGVKTRFILKKNLLGRPVKWVDAVDCVDLAIDRGECLGLVGESGCGKSTLGRSILCLVPIHSGRIFFRGDDLSLDENGMLKKYRPKMQMVFQNPGASMNPRMTVFAILEEALMIRPDIDKADHLQIAADFLSKVDLLPEHLFRYPREFSGGQQQRICIARALATRPELIVFDEPTSSLDVSVQAQIISLIKRLKDSLDLTYLFISHDLGIMEHICDRMAVMYAGRVVEIGEAKAILSRPRHPYTRALLGAIPIAHPRFRKKLSILKGGAPNLTDPPEGCRFHPRCKYASDICRREVPGANTGSGGSRVDCHHPLDSRD